MRAVVVERFGGPEEAVVREVPTPEPGPGQVLIEVASAAVNPVDLVTRRGVLAAAGLHGQPPLRLGWDVAGTVRSTGPGVRRIRPRAAVIGLSDRLHAPSKTHADLVVLDEDAVAAVDDRLDPDELALLPLAGLTAWQALDLAGVTSGTTVLVTGAAGSVGSMAVRLAQLGGARVVASGRAEHGEALEREALFVDSAELAAGVRDLVPGGVDAVIDTAGLGLHATDALRPGGRHVGLDVTGRPPPLRATTSASVAVRADWRQLAVLGTLLASRALTVGRGRGHVMRLDEAAQAYAALEQGRRRHIVLHP